ncbi:hypothetical protein BIU88_07565 [Chlorobaculum limnaeum]|uniref:Uncharacterized protein n=1 Tax=Chlorobaculum limnaeum TaxID=274537 RepID=A0A1D8D4C1_CHLLM|nr:hypothetical protein BIU88_07565 [Chlorobaculum limnaeum]
MILLLRQIKQLSRTDTDSHPDHHRLEQEPITDFIIRKWVLEPMSFHSEYQTIFQQNDIEKYRKLFSKQFCNFLLFNPYITANNILAA